MRIFYSLFRPGAVSTLMTVWVALDLKGIKASVIASSSCSAVSPFDMTTTVKEDKWSVATRMSFPPYFIMSAVQCVHGWSGGSEGENFGITFGQFS